MQGIPTASGSMGGAWSALEHAGLRLIVQRRALMKRVAGACDGWAGWALGRAALESRGISHTCCDDWERPACSGLRLQRETWAEALSVRVPVPH